MYERFTDRARRVVVLAQEEARTLNHNHVGSEHLLLGMLDEGEGLAFKALSGLGVSLQAAQEQVRLITEKGQKTQVGHIPFSPHAKKTLELSLREAVQLGHNYIGTEHLLLGLITEGLGMGFQILERLGIDPGELRRQVIQTISRYFPVEQPQVTADAVQDSICSSYRNVVIDLHNKESRQSSHQRQADELSKPIERLRRQRSELENFARGNGIELPKEVS